MFRRTKLVLAFVSIAFRLVVLRLYITKHQMNPARSGEPEPNTKPTK